MALNAKLSDLTKGPKVLVRIKSPKVTWGFQGIPSPQKHPKPFLLLMEEILHHLGYINLVNNGINYISTGAGFLPSTVGWWFFTNPSWQICYLSNWQTETPTDLLKVEPSHLTNMRKSNWQIETPSSGENKIILKPPVLSIALCWCRDST